jgi:hypothetical protein
MRIWDITHLLGEGRQADRHMVDPPQVSLEVEQLVVGEQGVPASSPRCGGPALLGR